MFNYCQTSVLLLYKGATSVDNRAHGHFTLAGSLTRGSVLNPLVALTSTTVYLCIIIFSIALDSELKILILFLLEWWERSSQGWHSTCLRSGIEERKGWAQLRNLQWTGTEKRFHDSWRRSRRSCQNRSGSLQMITLSFFN